MLVVLVLLSFAVRPIWAHEFWIAPHSYVVAPGESILGDLRVGQDFDGIRQRYFTDMIARFDLADAQGLRPVKGRYGDAPALNISARGTGLAIAVYESVPQRLTYRDFTVFSEFAASKGWAAMIAEHKVRGLPDKDFAEDYSRHVKALVAVGEGAGEDRAFGMAAEIVALANPYTIADDALPVQVFYEGAPRPGALIDVFERDPGGGVTRWQVTADDSGKAEIVTARARDYMLDTVVLRSADNDDLAAGPVWESLWAAMTFRRPD